MNNIIDDIKNELNTYVSKNIDNMFYSIELHNNLQKYIANMAKTYDLKSVIEYKVKYEEKNGYIDVVWKDKSKNIIFAMEIDSSIRIKSIKKLSAIKAGNKIWILYSSNFRNYKYNKLMRLYNKNKDIKIIYLGALREYIRNRNFKSPY